MTALLTALSRLWRGVERVFLRTGMWSDRAARFCSIQATAAGLRARGLRGVRWRNLRP